MDVDWNLIANFYEHITRLRDPYENYHGMVVGKLSSRLAKELGYNKNEIALIEVGARLHDIGKLLIAEELLNKPGRLTNQEWAMMKAHPQQGIEILSIFVIHPIIHDIVLHHHENLDGSGYPDGLKKDEISKVTRIVRLADTFDSIARTRSYAAGKSIEATLEIIGQDTDIKYDKNYFTVLKKIIARDGYSPDFN